MTYWQENLEQQIPQECKVVTCSRDGCTLDMEGAPSPFVLIDLDCSQLLSKYHKLVKEGRCDYLFLGWDSETDPNFLWVVPIEIKVGNPKVKEVLRQLQQGAAFAASLLPSNLENISLLPLAVNLKELHKAERYRRRNRRNKVKLGGLKKSVRFVKCGTSLADSLKATICRALGPQFPTK